MSTSDNDHDDEFGGELFTCRLCPGSTFTAGEKELHRQLHRENGNLLQSGSSSSGDHSELFSISTPSERSEPDSDSSSDDVMEESDDDAPAPAEV